MASSTLIRTISAVQDERSVLNNSNFARLPNIGTNWTKIRIACRMTITDGGGNITSTPRLAIGMCSGASQIFQDPVTAHWVGVISNAATWIRSAGPPVLYTDSGAGGFRVAKKVGAVLTLGATTLGNVGLFNLYEASTANRSAVFVDITKGSPNFTFAFFHRTAANPSDVSLADYGLQSGLSTPALANHAFNSANLFTLAVSEADGALDHVNIAWDRADPRIEVSDLKVARLL